MLGIKFLPVHPGHMAWSGRWASVTLLGGNVTEVACERLAKDALTLLPVRETCSAVAPEKGKSGRELEVVARKKGGVGKLKSASAKALDVAGGLARFWKGDDGIPLQETFQREAAILRGEEVESGEEESAPAKQSTGWVERADWVRLFERRAVAREIGSKVPESMSAEAWVWILGAPMELAKSNLRELEALLSGQEGWTDPLVNVAGRLQAYEHALDLSLIHI